MSNETAFFSGFLNYRFYRKRGMWSGGEVQHSNKKPLFTVGKQTTCSHAVCMNACRSRPWESLQGNTECALQPGNYHEKHVSWGAGGVGARSHGTGCLSMSAARVPERYFIFKSRSVQVAAASSLT